MRGGRTVARVWRWWRWWRCGRFFLAAIRSRAIADRQQAAERTLQARTVACPAKGVPRGLGWRKALGRRGGKVNWRGGVPDAELARAGESASRLDLASRALLGAQARWLVCSVHRQPPASRPAVRPANADAAMRWVNMSGLSPQLAQRWVALMICRRRRGAQGAHGNYVASGLE